MTLFLTTTTIIYTTKNIASSFYTYSTCQSYTITSPY